MIRKILNKIVLLLGLSSVLLCSCRPSAVPKPYGYVRLSVPDTMYSEYSGHIPFRFALSQNAKASVSQDSEGAYWIDLYYPSLKATMHGSYFPLHDDLDILTDDAIKLVYKHAAQATAIPEQAYVNDSYRVYGVLFYLQGNVASPFQFFLTDSVKHFFKASVYCECRPNADSLAPIYDYLEQDVKRLIESWQWVE